MKEILEQGRGKGWYLRLLQRHDVYLVTPRNRGKRFVGLFRETWRPLPYAVRRRILRHWRMDCHHLNLNLNPTIQLVGYRIDELGVGGLSGTKAVAGDDGHSLMFRADIVDAYPDELVRDLIAHELVHIFGYACGWYQHGVDDPIQSEEEADAVVEMWGFSSTAIDEWDLAHGVGVPDLTGMDDAAKARWAEEQRELYLKYGR